MSRDGSDHLLDGPGVGSFACDGLPGGCSRPRSSGRRSWVRARLLRRQRTLTWVGGNGPNWSTRQNWIPEEIPSRGDDLVFPASANLVTINDLVDLSVNSITIRDNYIISGLPLEITGDHPAGEPARCDGYLDAGPHSQEGCRYASAPTDGTLDAVGRCHCQVLREGRCSARSSSPTRTTSRDLIGVANCGVIRATHAEALALGVTRGPDALSSARAARFDSKPIRRWTSQSFSTEMGHWAPQGCLSSLPA